MFQEIITFWFEEIDQSQWLIKDDDFDALIHNKYLEIHSKAAQCELSAWREYPEGRLAGIYNIGSIFKKYF